MGRPRLAAPTADMVAQALKQAARDLGKRESEYATHSLCTRIRGATALLHAGATPDKVRQFGRWRSDTWMQYTFNSQHAQ